MHAGGASKFYVLLISSLIIFPFLKHASVSDFASIFLDHASVFRITLPFKILVSFIFDFMFV